MTGTECEGGKGPMQSARKHRRGSHIIKAINNLTSCSERIAESLDNYQKWNGMLGLFLSHPCSCCQNKGNCTGYLNDLSSHTMASMNTHIDYFLTLSLKLWTQRSWLSVTRAFSGGDSWAVSWGCTHLKSGWPSCTAVTRGLISLQTQAGISKGLHDCPHSVVISPQPQEIQEDKVQP